MKTLFFLFILLSQTFSFAKNWEGCEDDINKWLHTPREVEILHLNEEALTTYGMSSCEGDLSVNIMVAIHEGVHFIDLGILQKPTSAKGLYLINQERLQIPNNTLPSPFKVLEESRHQWQFKGMESTGFMGDYKEYILDKGTLSSNHAAKGIGTEFNAYAHGLLSSWNIREHTAELTLPYPYILKAQRSGLVSFATMTAIYFNELKKNYPKKWKDLIANDDLLSFYRTLYKQASDTLTQTNHCDKHVIGFDQEYATVVEKIFPNEILTEMNISMSKEFIKKILTCH